MEISPVITVRWHDTRKEISWGVSLGYVDMAVADRLMIVQQAIGALQDLEATLKRLPVSTPTDPRTAEIRSWSEAASTAIREGSHYFDLDRSLVAPPDLHPGLLARYANKERRRQERSNDDGRLGANKLTPRGQETWRNPSSMVQVPHVVETDLARKLSRFISGVAGLIQFAFWLIAVAVAVACVIAFPVQFIALVLLLLIAIVVLG